MGELLLRRGEGLGGEGGVGCGRVVGGGCGGVCGGRRRRGGCCGLGLGDERLRGVERGGRVVGGDVAD